MREILFRGKAKAGYKWISEGEWIEGSLFYSDDESGIVCQIVTSYLSSNKDEPVMVAAYEVDPETVCQYTGLTDKNGRKIFEGDVVSAWSEGSHAIGRVKQRIDGLWLLYPAWQNKIMWGLCPNNKGKTTVEIIGNIFDNPELIGEQP